MLPQQRMKAGPLDLHAAEGLWRWMQGVQRFLDNFTLTPPLMGSEGRVWLDPVAAAKQISEDRWFLARITASTLVSGRHSYSWIKVTANSDGTHTDIEGTGAASGSGGSQVTFSPTITAGSSVLTGVAGTGATVGMVLIAPDGGPFPLGSAVIAVDEGSSTVTLDQPASSSAAANLTFAPQGVAWEVNDYDVAVDQVVRLFPGAIDPVFGQTYVFSYEDPGGGGGGQVRAFLRTKSPLPTAFPGTDTNFYYNAGSYSPTRPGGDDFSSVVDGYIVAIPFFEGSGGTLDRVGMYASAAGRTKARIALYSNKSDRELYPYSLVQDFGEIDDTTIGFLTLSVSQVMQPNTLYWVCVQKSVLTTRGIRCLTEPYSYMYVAGTDDVVFDTWVGWAAAFAYAAFPATFPTPLDTWLAGSSGALIPWIGLRYSD